MYVYVTEIITNLSATQQAIEIQTLSVYGVIYMALLLCIGNWFHWCDMMLCVISCLQELKCELNHPCLSDVRTERDRGGRWVLVHQIAHYQMIMFNVWTGHTQRNENNKQYSWRLSMNLIKILKLWKPFFVVVVGPSLTWAPNKKKLQATRKCNNYLYQLITRMRQCISNGIMLCIHSGDTNTEKKK